MVRRLVSERQLSVLLDLLERDRDLAVGRLAGTPVGHADVVSRWASIAQTLNSLGEGATKSGPEWKTYWHEQKYKARKRALDVRQHASGICGSRPRKPLREQELRIVRLIGEVAVIGNEARLPLNDPVLSANSSSVDPLDTAREVPVVLKTENMQDANNGSSSPSLSSHGHTEPYEKYAGLSGSSPTARRGQRRRRRFVRAVTAEPPRRSQDFEERRLAVDMQTSQAFQSIAEALSGIRDLLAELVRQRRL